MRHQAHVLNKYWRGASTIVNVLLIILLRFVPILLDGVHSNESSFLLNFLAMQRERESNENIFSFCLLI